MIAEYVVLAHLAAAQPDSVAPVDTKRTLWTRAGGDPANKGEIARDGRLRDLECEVRANPQHGGDDADVGRCAPHLLVT
jgi:hypothetical protein